MNTITLKQVQELVVAIVRYLYKEAPDLLEKEIDDIAEELFNAVDLPPDFWYFGEVVDVAFPKTFQKIVEEFGTLKRS